MADLQKKLDDLAKALEQLVKVLEEEGRSVPGSTDTATTPGQDDGKKDDSQGLDKKTTTGTVRVNTSLNIRRSPWGDIIGSFHNGDEVKILSQEGDWYKILHNGDVAYVHANYIETTNRGAGQTPVVRPNDTAAAPSSQPDASPPTAGSGRFGAAPCTPMPSYASSEFGPRNMSHSDYHYGIDLPIGNGTRLNALGDGVVTAAGFEPGGGKYIKVRYDNGYESFYCHLQSYDFQPPQRVSMGQKIASSDNTGQWTTGPHLHMGIKKNGQYVDPRSVPNLPLPPRR